jgi:hypothetical protein
MNKKGTMGKMIRAGATVDQIMKKLKVSRSYIYFVKSKMKKDKPLDINVGSEVGGLTLTKRKDNMHKWVRNDLLEKAKKDGFFAHPEVKADIVNHPPHYTVGGIEVIDFIEAKGLGYNLGNVVKYVSRAGSKDDALQDLQKARWYLNREIGRME